MSAPWWSQQGAAQPAALAADGVRPQLLADSARAVADVLQARIPAYTPEWTRRHGIDAGLALLRLFGEQMAPVLQRLNRLPDKALVELLNVAGVTPLPATPARVLLQFEVADNAPRSVQVPAGFQCSARANGELVVFETERSLYATAAGIAQVQLLSDAGMREIVPQDFYPFGADSRGGMLVGLGGASAPSPRLSLAFEIAGSDGAPAPASSGGAGLPAPPLPQLEWAVLDGGSAQNAAVILDDTAGLTRSGIVELALPASWRPTALGEGEPLRWLRLRIVHGHYATAPRVVALRLNCVGAVAARTIIDEVLQEVPLRDGREWTLARTPVLAGSLWLEVDEGDDFADGAPQMARWTEVAALDDAAADARVYTLDARRGLVTFGDGQAGAAVPRGYRNIHAVRYQVGGGQAGAVPAKAVTGMLNSVAYLKGVSNPLPASGGQDEEIQAQAIARGPQELRARGRAVTVADYALLARRAPGAAIARAHAVAGLHPLFPGQAQPGVVTVFVVPAASHIDSAEASLLPDAMTLAAVSGYLAEAAAPAGIEVVAAAPRYHHVRVEASIAVSARADASATIARVLQALDLYLDARSGGSDGTGWPFGGSIVYAELLRQVLMVAGVQAVQHLNLVVDGARVLACQDHAIAADALLVTGIHTVTVIEGGTR